MQLVWNAPKWNATFMKYNIYNIKCKLYEMQIYTKCNFDKLQHIWNYMNCNLYEMPLLWNATYIKCNLYEVLLIWNAICI